MATWIDRYHESSSLAILSRELFASRSASSGVGSIIKSVIKALKSGLAVGAVIAALSSAGYAGEDWKNFVNRAASEISSGNQDENLIGSIAAEELDYDSLQVPKSGPAKRTTQPAPQTTPEPEPQPAADENDLESMFKYISAHEGRGKQGKPGLVYKDHKGKLTVGVGHLMGTKESRQIFKDLFGNTVDYDAVLKGKRVLSEGEMQKLFSRDVDIRLAKARHRVAGFDGLRQETKNAIVDAIYRGDLGPKTSALMSEGRWEEAAVEYLNHAEYRKLRAAMDAGGPPNGVVPRMEQNARVFAAQANQ